MTPKPFLEMIKRVNAYRHWLKQLKERIRSSQIKAAIKVNTELLNLYWELGKEILSKEKNSEWGVKLMSRLSEDLLKEFPHIKGFSRSNLYYIRQWVQFYQEASIVQQAVGQLKLPDKKRRQSIALMPAILATIPWGHHLQIITKCKDCKEARFYIEQTTQYNWSRSMLVHQIESNLYKRKGKALSNFDYALPSHKSDLAKELLKNPYHFDFLMLGPKASEKDLENALLTHLTKFLLELGTGFAFIGKQYKLPVENKDYELDLLFYHIRLHCYVVIELKTDSFKPEYAGKLNFYLSAIDAQVKSKDDQPSIGLLLCKKAGELVVEYSLKNIGTPIGVSEYHLTEKIPTRLKGRLPAGKEIKKELKAITK